MSKMKALLFVAALLAFVASFGVAFARSLNSQPVAPTVCTISHSSTPTVCTGTTVQATPDTAYEQVLKDLHYGRGYCFFDGSFSINPQSCDTNVQPPPATPFPGCSDVNTGGVLSPNLKSVDFAGGTAYLFQSQQCGAVWAGFDDKAGSHTVDWVEIREVGSNRSQFQYLGSNRPTNAGDWTSTYMMSYIPGNTYCVDAAVDGSNLPEQCATV